MRNHCLSFVLALFVSLHMSSCAAEKNGDDSPSFVVESSIEISLSELAKRIKPPLYFDVAKGVIAVDRVAVAKPGDWVIRRYIGGALERRTVQSINLNPDGTYTGHWLVEEFDEDTGTYRPKYDPIKNERMDKWNLGKKGQQQAMLRCNFYPTDIVTLERIIINGKAIDAIGRYWEFRKNIHKEYFSGDIPSLAGYSLCTWATLDGVKMVIAEVLDFGRMVEN